MLLAVCRLVSVFDQRSVQTQEVRHGQAEDTTFLRQQLEALLRVCVVCAIVCGSCRLSKVARLTTAASSVGKSCCQGAHCRLGEVTQHFLLSVPEVDTSMHYDTLTLQGEQLSSRRTRNTVPAT